MRVVARAVHPMLVAVFIGGGVALSTAPVGVASARVVLPSTPVNTLHENAWHETVLHRFQSTGGPSEPDGAAPQSPLLIDASGDLLGTASSGGLYGAGAVFEMTAPSGPRRHWKESILYDFTNAGNDGGDPTGRLLMDPNGVLYGTTKGGGAFCHFLTFCIGGTVYSLAPPLPSQRRWTENVLLSFSDKSGGGDAPQSGLLIDAYGTLYGPASLTRFTGGGTIFSLAGAGSQWKETVLHSFVGGRFDDGLVPQGALIWGPDGALYGTTLEGGNETSSGICIGGCGTVFQLNPAHRAGGRWTERVLYAFSGQNGDGALPFAGLLMDATGTLFGTTYYGGQPGSSCPYGGGCGTVFKLAPPQHRQGAWTESVLHAFAFANGDGYNPLSDLVADGNGALYGTTYEGGIATCNGGAGCGIVFKLTPPRSPSGSWKESVLYEFGSSNDDGSAPAVGLTLYRGALYGTTEFGGGTAQCNFGCGTVFKLKPH